jgi:hypothetical protein
VDIVGYQHEVVHTGVLETLLSEEQMRASVAERLLGERVGRTLAPEREVRIGTTRRRPIDLAVTLDSPGGRAAKLGIEVKVDSAWTGRQLEDTVAPPDRGVLLALGCTWLAATQPEMPSQWRLVGPREWAAIVVDHLNGMPELETYARHVAEEAKWHAEAIERVNEGRRVAHGREATRLEHWAYFHEVVREVGGDQRWDRKTLISGPLLTLWIDAPVGKGNGAYVELMGVGGKRELCVKCWTHRHDLGAVQASVADRASMLPVMDQARRVRAVGASHKSCTALALSLDERRPQEAAAACIELSALLSTGW